MHLTKDTLHVSLCKKRFELIDICTLGKDYSFMKKQEGWPELGGSLCSVVFT